MSGLPFCFRFSEYLLSSFILLVEQSIIIFTEQDRLIRVYSSNDAYCFSLLRKSDIHSHEALEDFLSPADGSLVLLTTAGIVCFSRQREHKWFLPWHGNPKIESVIYCGLCV